MKIKRKYRVARAIGLLFVLVLFSVLVGWLWVPVLDCFK
jgi:hypothetical protein